MRLPGDHLVRFPHETIKKTHLALEKTLSSLILEGEQYSIKSSMRIRLC